MYKNEVCKNEVCHNNYNTNYIIEDSLDFKNEMSSCVNNKIINTDSLLSETCLISQEKLTKSHVKLPCSHTFNYIPLFNELCSQKQKNIYESTTLKIHQMKCPYCRLVFEHILPYIPSEYREKKHGINYPFKYGMPLQVECEWINKTGKNKNMKCAAHALYIGEETYCKSHYRKAQKMKEAVASALLK